METGNVDYVEQARQIVANKSALCFEGGGVLGIGHVGALTRLHELGGLKNVTHVVGTSVGSIIAAAIGCKADVQYIQEKMSSIKLPSFKDTSKFFLLDIIRFFRKYGWYKEDVVEDLGGSMMDDLTGNPEITFLEAFKIFNIKLTIVALSVNYNKTRYLNYITAPDLQIKKAIRMSSSIPVFYQGVWNDRPKLPPELFVDGGTTDNYPLHVLKEQGCPINSILGFKLFSRTQPAKYSEDPYDPVEEVDTGAPKNIYKHVVDLISIVHHQALRYHVEKDDWKLSVKTDIGNLTTTDFGITKDQQNVLFNNGRAAVDNYVNEVASLLSKGEYPL